MAKGIYTEDMGPPPSPPDMGSATPPPPPPPPRKKKSKRADDSDKQHADIYTADMPGQPPSPVDMGSVERRKKGGIISSASSRADGIASRGKTRGTIVRMG